MDRLLHYQFAITYECNLRCQHCCQFFDRLGPLGPESTMSVDELDAGIDAIEAEGIKVGKVRVTGGEPSLVPHLGKLVETIRRRLNPLYVRTYSNGVLGMRADGVRLCVKSVSMKTQIGVKGGHWPLMISPADLGIPPVMGFSRSCGLQSKCGRVFDRYGFLGCSMASSIGRLLGVRLHSRTPVMWVPRWICKHCPFTLPKGQMMAMQRAAIDGRIEYPTRTYRDAIEQYEPGKPLDWEPFLRTEQAR